MCEKKLKELYEARREYLRVYGEYVVKIILSKLRTELKGTEIEKFLQIPPKPRIKDTDSFLEKVIRKHRENPLDDITDQVGVRFVVLFIEDIKIIEKIIEEDPSWDSSKDRDFSEERSEKPDCFIYQSDHYIIRLKNDLSDQGATVPKRTACEIQIRTLLQHAYAEISHKADYKPSIYIPSTQQSGIRRSLAKGLALMETTDDIFADIKNKFNEYDAHINKLLCKSFDIYKTLTEEDSSSDSASRLIITDAYRDILRDVTPEDLDKWAEKHSKKLAVIKEKRKESVFYRDSVVVLVGFLVDKYSTSIRDKWPIDLSYLANVYLLLGLNPKRFID
ncbi:MAG: hypothetical protein LBP89_06515 [Helicobacteraceae bacterium]|jgi:ppGpp synthetase/RelA/SpoT-type nucleotidyltranferase|nr:hypothetical protein [Helicobacteraceae bacterium]